MSLWPEIRCQRGCERHVTRDVTVTIGGPTAYADLPPIPERFRRTFPMRVWDPDAHPVDGGPYCPAHDAVSETIATLGVWEPVETTVVMDVLSCSELLPARRNGGVSKAPHKPWFFDLGAQVGWFTLLAQTTESPVVAFECDQEARELLAFNSAQKPHDGYVAAFGERIGPGSRFKVEEPVALAKVDVEGAEPDAVEMLWPAIEAGHVDALIVEVSPVFHDGYPDLVMRLVGAGYRAYRLPGPSPNPAPLCERPGALLDDLEPHRLDAMPEPALRAAVASWHQHNVLFVQRYCGRGVASGDGR